MSRGAELLRSWRKARRMPQAMLACLIARRWLAGGAQRVCSWETGRGKPRRSTRRWIRRITGGMVPVSAWIQAPEAIRAGGQLDLIEMIAAGGRRRWRP
ncbi:MAG: hypothetical protein FJ125_11750 [Deltaproteobacteria bacterium]|nr:hypothetical protein [Deltaproteobacteria bacterium]